MRELLTLITIFLLLLIGWKQSFRSHWLQLIGKPTPTPVATRTVDNRRVATSVPVVPVTPVTAPPPATPRDTSWMWAKSKMSAPTRYSRGR